MTPRPSRQVRGLRVHSSWGGMSLLSERGGAGCQWAWRDCRACGPGGWGRAGRILQWLLCGAEVNPGVPAGSGTSNSVSPGSWLEVPMGAHVS